MYTSTELFHFVGRADPLNHERNWDVVRTVLKQGWISHPPHERGWGKVGYHIDLDADLVRGDLLVPSVTCYCDIPLQSLNIHNRKYGYFGLSFSRAYLIEYGARPVMYVPSDAGNWRSVAAAHLKEWQAVLAGLRQPSAMTYAEPARILGRDLQTLDEVVSATRSVYEKDFLAFVKPFDPHLTDDHPDNYYMEREWRKYGNLRCGPDDVTRVVVERSFAERARQEFPQFAEKITSLPVEPA
jgi:hypothetical protein